MRITIFGSGYVGLVSGACLADAGNTVVCVDVDARKIDMLKRGEIPIHEPGLDAMVKRNFDAGRLSFTTDAKAGVDHGQFQIIAVGTPPDEDGSADLRYVLAVAGTIGEHMTEYKVIVTKSTVPVGTADKVREAVAKALKARQAGVEYDTVSNPEFLKEGAAINDFMKPDRVVIGSDSAKAHEVLRHLYAPFVRATDRIHVMDARSAELTKYASNALLATRISFMNDLAILAEKLGADIELVRKGVGADPRIGPKFLFPGPGFGGSCFPKDISALMYVGQTVGHDLALVRATEEVNARQKKVLGAKIVKHFGGSLAGKRVAVWGLAFKPQTDDIRESPSLVLIDDLIAAGATVHAHDPQAMANVKAHYGDAHAGRLFFSDSMYGATEGADALALLTEWHEYRSPDFQRLKSVMTEHALFDGRNMWAPEEVRGHGFTYSGIGRL
jgi:UDPglucose 6-dehydrogenase